VKLIVAGSRDFTNYDLLKRTLDKLLVNQKDIEIVCGMARGADLLGKRYAEEKGYRVKEFPADWDGLVKKAGWIRNKAMAEYSDSCVVFIKNESPGSKMMIELAKEYKLNLRVIKV
jgi:hypothetical protein